MVDGRYYTIQQACEVLGCDDETVLSWIHAGELAAVNICKSRQAKRPTWRLAESELGRFLMSRRNPEANQVVAPKSTKRPSPKRYV